MVWRIEDPQGNEAAKVRWDIVPFTRGEGIDLGCGPEKCFPHMIGVDNGVDTELFGIPITPDVRITDALDLPFKDESLDFVFSSHMLEHIEDTVSALREAWRVLKDDGNLVLYLPHADHYPRIGTFGSNPDHKHDFVPGDVLAAINEVSGGYYTTLVNETRNDAMEYSFLLVVRKEMAGEKPRIQPKEWLGHEALRFAEGKTACVVRYGGFGDMIQSSNILPELKRQGYHVTMMTTPKGRDILEHDPHVDAWFIQDPDQVPNGNLHQFWKHHAARFDKFVNLSESIEGEMLALPGRANHAWPDAVRRARMGRNYLEWTAELAELPYTSEARFYPTAQETAGARAFLRFIANGRKAPLMLEQVPRIKTLLWVLAGSSVHKFYPHQDIVIANLLKAYPDLHIIFSGDAACVLLEAGWENNPRVHCESGEMSIRQTLTLAQEVDVVVGPETGVLNAVAFEEDVHKVVLLSHSTVENLTKHWISAAAVIPQMACYPCHRLHYGREFCPEDKPTGAAMCQMSIAPSVVFQAVASAFEDIAGQRRVANIIPIISRARATEPA